MWKKKESRKSKAKQAQKDLIGERQVRVRMFHIVIDSAIDHLQDYPSFTVIPLYLRVGEKFLKIALRLPATSSTQSCLQSLILYYESAQS